MFEKRYCESLQVKWLQSCSLSNFEDDPIFQDSILDCTRTVIFGIVKLYILTCFQDALKIPNALDMIYHI